MRSAIIIASTLLLMLIPAKTYAADSFVGKWELTVTPDEDANKAGEKEFKDTVEFTKGGKFVSDECKKDGFEEVDYEADTRRFGPAKFTAKPKSEKAGEAEWSGAITGDAISGTLVLTKKDGTKLNYTFKGTKKAK